MAKKFFNLIVGIAQKVYQFLYGIVDDTTDGMLESFIRSKRGYYARFIFWLISTIVLGIGFSIFAINSQSIIVVVIMIPTYVVTVGFTIPSSLFTKSEIISRWPHS